MMEHRKRKHGVIAALVHARLTREPHDTIADLVADVKADAARLRIPYGPDAITEALTLVARTRSLVTTPAEPLEIAPQPEIISRPEAAAIHARVMRRYRERPQ